MKKLSLFLLLVFGLQAAVRPRNTKFLKPAMDVPEGFEVIT